MNQYLKSDDVVLTWSWSDAAPATKGDPTMEGREMKQLQEEGEVNGREREREGTQQERVRKGKNEREGEK